MELTEKLSYNNFVRIMYKPTDPSSLGVTRILFGLLMMVDIPEERGGGELDIRWGDPKDCYFPLFSQLKPPPLAHMSLLYGVMWFGALGIALGWKFRISCLMFCVPYWYIIFLDKSVWNNHSYLYGLIGILLLGSSANHYWSVDGVFDKCKNNKHVPYWNYFVLKFQIFILYFYAGLKKTDMEWLEGYSMADLGMHWIFDPFKVIFTGEQIDFIIVHWSGFILDLSVTFLLMYGKTRPLGILFGSSFHIMNSRLFSLGMFPYVCLATMPLFCEANWPKKWMNVIYEQSNTNKNSNCFYPTENIDKKKNKISFKHKFVTALIIIHCGLQGFLPYSHFITKGYNNWTNGIYGYSWDMMIHAWDTVLVVVRVVDNVSGKEHFLDHNAWTQNDRWSKHADMNVQYAECVKNNLLTDLRHAREFTNSKNSISQFITSENISIYLDVWCSLNGRFQQRMYDPNYDLLKARWSPFEKAEWLMPLLSEYSGYRAKITNIQEHVYSWSNYSDVLFVADFPGLYLENYIVPDLRNVTLTVLEGEVEYEDELDSVNVKLTKGDRTFVPAGVFHKIFTVSSEPSCYMYTYFNRTKELLKEADRPVSVGKGMSSPFPLLEERKKLFDGTMRMFGFVGNAILNILYDIPMIRRTRIS